jgi:uncharacterized repeat protein (TIGR03943 family)
MSREVQGLALAALGVVLVRLSTTGAYLFYVKATMQPFVIAAGAVLIVLGAWVLVDSLRRRSVSPDDHGHEHGQPAIGWLLLVPTAAILLIAPPPLGAFSASRESTYPVILDTSPPPLPATDPVPLYLSDFVSRASVDDGSTLAGRTVELTGFVVPDPSDGWLLARMQIACCAADAFASKVRPIGLPPDAIDLPADTWVTVTGTFVPGTASAQGADPVPSIQIDTLRRVPQPANPYD